MAETNAITRPRVSLRRLGSEGQPLVVIDDFTGRAAELRAAGRAAGYAAVKGYPGIRSPVPASYIKPVLPLLAEIIRRAFAMRGSLAVESCSYSIVSRAPDELQPAQRMPHYDDPGGGVLALLHYLGSEEDGGTAFYRHRRTGFETMRPERLAPYNHALAQDEAEFGPLAQAYHYGDSDRFEMIGEVEAKVDRAIIYRGRTLHSGIIPEEPDPSSAHERGRLTINTFLVAQ
ncbi:DUF6445 family protein [Qipengyuania atrilutea]|uniref:Uncharacterized protein n=1 Tax=Qipengyuania atrilutea TaxID=2744473 RepID=A0A850GWT0_9SPHN|nr:DUF6445 family protein [Actirhodobacter atriluteus]NVD44024.1 hypothetical protein [Actirhodobacter atriluteus]